MLKYLDEVVLAEKSKLREGQTLSIERMTTILLHTFRKARAGESRPSQDSRGPDGNINDYVEKRRPFIAPNPNSAPH